MHVRFGTKVDITLPKDRLVEEERETLQNLLTQRENAAERLGMIEQRLQLALLQTRDRRGLSGPTQIDPISGTITTLDIENV